MTVLAYASAVADRGAATPFDDVDYPPVTTVQMMIPLSFAEMVAAVSMFSLLTPADLDTAAAFREEVDFLIVFYGVSKVRDAAETLRREPPVGDTAVWVEWVREHVAQMVA